MQDSFLVPFPDVCVPFFFKLAHFDVWWASTCSLFLLLVVFGVSNTLTLGAFKTVQFRCWTLLVLEAFHQLKVFHDAWHFLVCDASGTLWVQYLTLSTLGIQGLRWQIFFNAGHVWHSLNVYCSNPQVTLATIEGGLSVDSSPCPSPRSMTMSPTPSPCSLSPLPLDGEAQQQRSLTPSPLPPSHPTSLPISPSSGEECQDQAWVPKPPPRKNRGIWKCVHLAVVKFEVDITWPSAVFIRI